MPALQSSSAEPACSVAPRRLRRSLLWAIALKLILLFSIKAAFFPHRLTADDAAQGVAERIASPAGPVSESLSKDQP